MRPGLAAANGVFLEVSASRGHDFANGHVVRVAGEAGARIVLDSDAHAPEDLLTRELAGEQVALGAGLSEEDARGLLEKGPHDLLAKIGVKHGSRRG